MSVIKSKRGESEMEFIYTARQLEIHTIRKCVHFSRAGVLMHFILTHGIQLIT